MKSLTPLQSAVRQSCLWEFCLGMITGHFFLPLDVSTKISIVLLRPFPLECYFQLL
jgi:hypothetical protein